MTRDLIQAARQLRAEGRIADSYRLVQQANKEGQRVDASLVWQHQPLFWEELAAGCCRLTRRNAADAAFIKDLWSDQEFVRRFHRLTMRIPQKLTDLERILGSEYAALVSDLNSLHWVIRDEGRKPWGVLSLTNISLAHQRAEVLLGVRKGAPFGLVATALLLLFRFWFGVLKFQKLYTLTFDDNDYPLQGLLHLGFKVEGRLRRHFYDPAKRAFVDVIQASMLAEEAFSASNRRVMKRLRFNQV